MIRKNTLLVLSKLINGVKMLEKFMSKLLKLNSAKFAIVLMLGLALVVPVGASAALTTAQVDAILGLLNSFGADATTVTNVRASLTGGTPSTPGSSLDFGTATLRVGSSGQYVKNLQTLVGAVSDGAFGPNTKAKVMAWQAANGLVADGVFGPASRAKAMGGSAYVPGTPATPVVNPTGPVSAMLAVDNPAARSVVDEEAGADLAHFLFTGAGTVTNVTLQRIGISADASLSNVYLYDGAVRLTDAASVSSGSKITFNDPNGLFVVNGSKIISVRADMAGTAGETVGIALVSYTALGQTAVTLGSPLAGNYMTVADATLAGVAFGSVTPGANTDLTPDSDIVVWQSTATVTNRDVWLTRFAIREIGSIAKTDVSNIRLMVGTNTVATVANPDANGYVTFVPTSPLKLTTGSHTFKVMADVTGGSSNSFTFSIRNKTDIGLVDSQYNVGLLTSTAIGDLAGNLQTVDTGYVTVQKATDSPTSTVVLSGTDITLARFTAKTYGENVKADTLIVDLASSADGGVPTLRNGRVLIDGQQVGSTSTLTTVLEGTSFNINHTFTAGTTAIIEVRADVYNNRSSGTALAAGDTLTVNLSVGVNNAQGLVSGDATLDVPTADVSANTLTVGSGSMTLAKDQAYGNQSVVVPTTGTLLGSWVLTSGTTEALNLDTIRVDFPGAVDAFSAAADISNVYVMYGSKSTSAKSTVSLTAAANTWNISEAIPVNSSMTFKVYGDIASSATNGDGTADTVIPKLLVSGTSTSGTAVNTNGNAVLDGQTITATSSGTLTVALDTNTPVAAQVVAGSTDSAGALKVKLTGTNEKQYVKTVTVYVDTLADSAAVAYMNLAWSATSNGTYASVGDKSVTYDVSTYPGYSTWSLTGLSRVEVPKDGSVYLKVTPTYVSSGQTAVTGLTPQLFLGNIEAEGTSTLVAGGAASLVNTTGIVVQAGSSATYADSTESIATAIASAATRTLDMTGTTAFVPGDVIFIDTYAADCTTATPDNLWSGACEELMVVLANDGAGNLVVERGAFGTTAQAVYEATDSIYSLGGLVANTNGIIGSAMTVLNTKLTLALDGTSPSGSTSTGNDKIVFAFTASAANNPSDTATNTATITYVDITATESGTTTLTDLKLYPSTYDTNSTYATTCGAITASKWRCTMSTAGSTNQIDEGSSRTYIVRGDTAYAANGSIDISIAALGTSSLSTSLNTPTTNSVLWTDGTTPQNWVNQASSYLQSSSPLSSAVASGTADATDPAISTVAIANVLTAASIAAGDTITITFNEVIDPSTINASLVPGGTVTGVAGASTGGVITAIPGGAGGGDDTITVTNILTLTLTDAGGATTFAGNTLALDATGKILTVTVGTGTAQVVDRTAIAGAGINTTVADVSGNNLATTAPTIAAGNF